MFDSIPGKAAINKIIKSKNYKKTDMSKHVGFVRGGHFRCHFYSECLAPKRKSLRGIYTYRYHRHSAIKLIKKSLPFF